jgi:hypothetical protein
MVSTAPTPTHLPVLDEFAEGLPNISGWEKEVRSVVQRDEPVFLPITNVRLEDISAAFAIALHMHQPTIPAGPNGEYIGHLQYMFEHTGEGDNHNAGPFSWCYSRMGEFIPELVANGCNPRVMLDYSGNLLWGLRQMGRHDVIDSLKRITCDPQYYLHVEWLGTMWSHAVVPSTPLPDLKLHIQAWQHYFASIFGWEALARVKGFSPPEMHLPNHPDTLFEFIKALKESGYRWIMVQEHSVETLEGHSLGYKHLPHRLMARNSHGETTSITALIKTQGSDTKLVAQMQPYYEAKTLSKQQIGSVTIPPIVTQIGDGENGGVMMNEFPDGFKRTTYEIAQNNGGKSGTVALNGTEYLELIEAAGCSPDDYPTCQAVQQHKIWQRLDPENVTPEKMAEAIAQLKQEDHQFHVDGSSWTNNLNWVQGYENVVGPMNSLSALFHQKIDPLLGNETLTQQPRYRQALLNNLLTQTSCFRYWGQGMWTDFARSIYERAIEQLNTDF